MNTARVTFVKQVVVSQVHFFWFSTKNTTSRSGTVVDNWKLVLLNFLG